MTALGWTLQVIALVIVGSALLIGLAYESMSAELGMLAVGGLLFVVGRRLQEHRD